MTTSFRHRSGGFGTFPNRWIDAGYMAKAPGSVTQVYLFLNRWAGNATGETTQPIATISRKCGLTGNVVKKACRTLEAWGVIERQLAPGPNGANVWVLNDLADDAPKLPDLESYKGHKTGGKESAPGSESAPPQSDPHIRRSLSEVTNVTSAPHTVTPELSSTEECPAPKTASRKPGAPKAEASRKLSPPNPETHAIMGAWIAILGAPPASAGKTGAAAKALANAGFTADDIRPLYEWARAQDWIRGAVDLNLMASVADKYRTGQRRGVAQQRRVVL